MRAGGLLSSCGSWAPEYAGSVVVARGLSCPMARGILAPRPGIEPMSLALECKFLTTGPPGKSHLLLFFLKPAFSVISVEPWEGWEVMYVCSLLS